MAHAAPSKKQRGLMRDHYGNPYLVTQAEVMKVLGIKSSGAFYRVFARSILADRRDAIKSKTN